MLESEFQKYILEAFEYDRNIKIWRNNTGATKIDDKRFIRFGVPGAADIIGIVKHFRCKICNASQDGIFLAIEVKGTKGKTTDKQTEWLNEIEDYNGITIVLKPIESDPIGLRERIEQRIYSMKCPQCVSKSYFERND